MAVAYLGANKTGGQSVFDPNANIFLQQPAQSAPTNYFVPGFGGQTSQQGGKSYAVSPSQTTPPAGLEPVQPSGSVLGQTTAPSSGGGGGSMDSLVNAMVQKGGYDASTARQVAGADFDRFWNEFMGNTADIAQQREGAAKQAALNRWTETKQSLDTAKVSAKDLLDWAVSTITKQKEPLLAGLQADQELETKQLEGRKGEEKAYYDEAKQSVLTTYRDLSLKSERIMRGMGMADSSRSMEAQFKLDTLMAKDISQWSDKEVKAVQAINDKLEYVTKTYTTKRQTVEDEAQAKVDKANIDYQDQVRQIDNNYLINDNQKAEAIEAARLAAEELVANAKAEAGKARLELEKELALLKADTDNFIADTLSDVPALGTLRQGTNAIDQYILSTGGNVQQQTPLVGFKKPTSKDEEDILSQSIIPASSGLGYYDLGRQQSVMY